MFIQRLLKSLSQHEVNYALVGGYAVALHGAVRGTVDVDLIIEFSLESFVGTEKALHAIGLNSRLPIGAQDVFTFREEYINNRNLIAWSFVNPQNPAEMVDIIITLNLREVEYVSKPAFGMEVKVLSIHELIAMKKRAGRPQDIEDISVLETLT